ncbi:MAG TPA: penicillin-binding protein 1C [Rudaea sp.]|nr:penicillin-binding protein 1C [Rudaea sp.]
MNVRDGAPMLLQFIRRWQNTLMALLLLGIGVVGVRLWPHPSLAQFAPSSTAVYDERGRLLRLTLASDERYRLWVPLAEMPPALVDGVLLHEDAWFRWHPGFNPVSLARGAFVTYLRGGNRQGGSTITMQLARLMYRLNTRSPGGKFVQVLRSIQLELFYSKDAILEAYLNLAPYGRNIEGAGAASLVYFDKPVAHLTLPEALTLAVLPQDPSRRAREEAGETTIGPRLVAARARLFRRWLRAHPDDAAQAALFQLPLALRPPERLPFAAPHFVEEVLADARLRGAHLPTLRTTLDLDLQHLLERQVVQHVQRHSDRGVRNAVAMIVDTRDLGIKALVGSVDYGDASIAGQVDGTLAKRSPGSALKPFIYALGFDQGVLHPQTVLRDVPTSFGPFTPENFDGRFLGPVTATEALVRSRNIPAVYVASKLKNPDFYQFLKDAGVARMADEDFYGLSLVLGGGEVTMQELARLYAMLANRGSLAPLRRLADEPRATDAHVLSDESSFMVLDMLRQNPRPDDAALAEPSRLPVYWKTGTSWGFRDAWTAGIVGPYVIVVWVGNFDGAGNPALVGIEMAAPLFFHIVDALEARDPKLSEPPHAPPRNIKRVEICLASGDLPNAWCPRRAATWFIPGKSPIRVSSIHRPLTIDNATGGVACPPFDPGTTHTEVYEYWPSDLAKVFRQAGIPRRAPPPLPDCSAAADDGAPPQIVSPLRGETYAHRLSRAGEERIAFNATVDAGVQQVYWFVDDGFVGAVRAGEPLLWQPQRAGEFTVRAVDDRGRADVRALRIEAVE